MIYSPPRVRALSRPPHMSCADGSLAYYGPPGYCVEGTDPGEDNCLGGNAAVYACTGDGNAPSTCDNHGAGIGGEIGDACQDGRGAV